MSSLTPTVPPSVALRNRFYHVGGVLAPTIPSYVERPADRELYEALRAGELCYVLDTRQMGKSSLIARVGSRLRQEGSAVAFVDVSSFGQTLTVDQWYAAHLDRLAGEFKLEAEIDAFIDANDKLPAVDLWLRGLRDVVLARLANERVVIVFDEIDHGVAFRFRQTSSSWASGT
jgi:hypothetical protein